MPSRNTRRTRSTVEQTVHVYNRGIDKQVIFKDDHDRRQFLSILKRHLSSIQHHDERGRPFKNFSGSIELIAFCLMPNHFHLVLHECEPGALSTLMCAITTGYVKYFNRRHGRSRPLLSKPFRSRPLADIHDIRGAIRYVHRNHPNPNFEFSSHHLYLADPDYQPPWIKIEKGLAVFGGRANYLRFMASDS